MSVETLRRCDVMRTRLDIKTYSVSLQEIRLVDNGPDEGEFDKVVETIIDRTIDLSPRAFKRLNDFIVRGTTALCPRKAHKTPERQPPAENAD